jgi:peptidoglycan/LPS O-acetylase OafA/YrhL
VLPNLLSPLGVLSLGGFLVFGFARFLKRLKLKGCNDLHQFALISGGLAFFIFLAPLQELDKTRTDNPWGMGLVGLAFLVGLLLMGWRIRRRTRFTRIPLFLRKSIVSSNASSLIAEKEHGGGNRRDLFGS